MSKLSKKYADKVSAKEERAIKKAMEEQEKNKNSFRSIPAGEYPVIVDKLEVNDSLGFDQISIWFKITDGEFKNSKIFYNSAFTNTDGGLRIKTWSNKDPNTYLNGWLDDAAGLLADMLDDEDISKALILNIFAKCMDKGGMDLINDFLADLAEAYESMAWDLYYDITLSKKTNPKTGKPYENASFEVLEVYDKE